LSVQDRDHTPKRAAESGRLAVALKYTPGEGEAPRVVASGKGAIADGIVACAEANEVLVREDRDLVALLSAVDIGEQIPLQAFAAVAEILAFVYRVNGAFPLGTTPQAEGS
jgi:flagellar biosynthesis protein